MTLLFAFPEQQALARTLKAERGEWEWRHFPDGESYVRVMSEVRGKAVAILCSLDRPDEKTLPLLFLTRTLKELGAAKVTLIAPYLGYMRQDKRFQDGEAVTSEIFGSLLSAAIDALVTVDPHLHRHARLEDIYRCECTVLSAAPLMAQWIKAQVKHPVIVGPDMESEQWVQQVAAMTAAPYVILEKTRRGDHDVEVTLPDMTPYRQHTPVLVDDIISTATTMIKTMTQLHQKAFTEIACVATHGLFAGDSYARLVQAGATHVVTANTIPHDSNALDISALLGV